MLKLKINNKNYGKFDGFTLSLEGFNKLPRWFSALGFKTGKYILERLEQNFGKFSLGISKKGETTIKKTKAGAKVQLNIQDYETLRAAFLAAYRSEGQKVVDRHLARLFSADILQKRVPPIYSKGTISQSISAKPNLRDFSKKDIQTIIRLLPILKEHKIQTKKDFKELIGAQKVLHYLQLEKILAKYETLLDSRVRERGWQAFFRENLLALNPAYIKLIEKTNIDIEIKLPDFLLFTIDGYVDVLDIKTPRTPLLAYDRSHNNYYWTTEISKAVSQVENYIASIEGVKDRLRNILKDKYKIEFRVIRPRGLIIAGRSQQLNSEKEHDDFKLLNESLINCKVLLYDEFLKRIKNLSSILKSYEN